MKKLFEVIRQLFAEKGEPETIDMEFFNLQKFEKHYVVKYGTFYFHVWKNMADRMPDGLKHAIIHSILPDERRIEILLGRCKELLQDSSTWSAPDGLSIEDITGSEGEFTVMCDGYCGKIVLSRDDTGFYMFKVDSFARLQSDTFIFSFLEIVI